MIHSENSLTEQIWMPVNFISAQWITATSNNAIKYATKRLTNSSVGPAPGSRLANRYNTADRNFFLGISIRGVLRCNKSPASLAALRHRRGGGKPAYLTTPMIATAPLLKTPLHDWHAAHGGRMVDFAGWSMPVQYSSIVAEHNATRTAVGLFESRTWGGCEFAGSDASEFLDAGHAARGRHAAWAGAVRLGHQRRRGHAR